MQMHNDNPVNHSRTAACRSRELDVDPGRGREAVRSGKIADVIICEKCEISVYWFPSASRQQTAPRIDLPRRRNPGRPGAAIRDMAFALADCASRGLRCWLCSLYGNGLHGLGLSHDLGASEATLVHGDARETAPAVH